MEDKVNKESYKNVEGLKEEDIVYANDNKKLNSEDNTKMTQTSPNDTLIENELVLNNNVDSNVSKVEVAKEPQYKIVQAEYKVRSKDNLESIINKFGMSRTEFFFLNPTCTENLEIGSKVIVNKKEIVDE